MNTSLPQLPVVKLRPGKGRRLADGAPWAFRDEIAMDRRTRGLEAGTLVQLVEGDRDFGLAAFNPESKIAARTLETPAGSDVDLTWFAERLTRALALREQLFDAPNYRLVHAEADGLPGVVVDRFGDAAVIQPNAAWADRLIDPLTDALVAVTGCRTVILNGGGRARELEGLSTRHDVLHGTIDGAIATPMNGAIYLADLMGGQKTGLFYDQRPNQAFAQNFAKGARVLDLFCHVGGFGLAALASGAEHVIAVDSSAPALELAEQGAEQMKVSARFETRRADGFEALRALSGERFDMVICDPPAFAPSRDALKAGLRAYERIARGAAPLVGPGGTLCLCSCSHAVDVDAFHRACTQGIRRAGRSGALIHSGRAGPDHPVHLWLPETSYLKALFFRLDG